MTDISHATEPSAPSSLKEEAMAGRQPADTLMTDSVNTSIPPSKSGLDGHQDARALVKLIQCQVCSRPFRTPITLPCGNSICRTCLPSTHQRANISYPINPERQEAIFCPFASCGKVHSVEDCSVTVLLVKILEAIRVEVSRQLSASQDKKTALVEIRQQNKTFDAPDAEKEVQEPVRSDEKIFKGGRLVATFECAETGGLGYASDVEYNDSSEGDDIDISYDVAALEKLKETCHKELECHVCWNLMLDPVTTPCGHTYCRKCLARVLDHSRQCPFCRKALPIPPSLRSQPSNKTLSNLLSSVCPEQVAARARAVEEEETGGGEGLSTAIFVCSTAFPEMPLILHIFEPRYRLMIRRAVEADGQFGMTAYNARQEPQDELGVVDFMKIGVMLQIQSYQMLPDGRSLIVCKGLYRFRVLEHDVLDGYVVGRVQRIEDISLAEEERLEAEETSQPAAAATDMFAQIDRLPTQQLLEIGMTFVQRAREQSARWLQGGIVEIYGDPPNDPALFPYWFASVLPLRDGEKYNLLPANSVRERLKVTARWIHRIESQRW